MSFVSLFDGIVPYDGHAVLVHPGVVVLSVLLWRVVAVVVALLPRGVVGQPTISILCSTSPVIAANLCKLVDELTTTLLHYSQISLDFEIRMGHQCS